MSLMASTAKAIGMRLLQSNINLPSGFGDRTGTYGAGVGGPINGAGGSDNSTGFQETNQNDTSGNAYEFVAFLLWYIFLVLCCVIPTCCAYRRRRQVEARLAQQQSNMDRWQATNMFIVAGGFRAADSEQLQAHRTKYLEQELKETTMRVSESDIEEKPSGSLPVPVPTEVPSNKSWSKGRVQSLHDDNDTNEQEDTDEKMPADIELAPTTTPTTTTPVVVTEQAEAQALPYDVEEVENAGSLRLPIDRTNGGRSIPAVCTICLCPYENGEHVSWSPDTACQHAFHKDCIIAWLAKKDEPKCPICRQDFCLLSEIPEMDQETANPFSFSQSLTRALALSRLEAAAMEAHNNNNANTNAMNATINMNATGSNNNNSSSLVRWADEETGEAPPATNPGRPEQGTQDNV